jgi:hypothetical protein
MHKYAGLLWKNRFAAIAVLVLALLAGLGIVSRKAYERQQRHQRALREEHETAIQAAAILKGRRAGGHDCISRLQRLPCDGYPLSVRLPLFRGSESQGR